MSMGKPPGIISAPRLIVLFAALFVSIGSGTNYVYSAWAPQLGSRLRINHTQLNIVGLAGNVGVYSSGPICGRIVDARGPRIPLVGAFFFLLTGYYGIKSFFDAGLPEDARTMPTFSFVLLVLCSYITGVGGGGGLSGSVNSTAKTFPDKTRATATGLVLGGFGLSAFIFSTIAHVVYAGNTSGFLQVLALGTSLPMIVGYFLVRPIPLPSEQSQDVDQGPLVNDAAASTSALMDDSRTRLLDYDESDINPNDPESCTQPRTHGHTRSRSLSLASSGAALAHAHVDDNLPNIFGIELWKNGDFWIIFTILSILSGTGLMYINNVGAMSQTLYAKNNLSYDANKAAQWQATQVSTISVMNFLGRILIGVISDAAKNAFAFPRSYCLVLVSTGIFLSQVTAAHIDTIENLWLASALLGLSYGSVFSLLPQVCIEWFGLSHFSENWGYLSLAPMVAGNFFMVLFGRNLDAHESKSHSQGMSTEGMRALQNRAFSPISAILNPLMRKTAENSHLADDAPKCLQGKECYVAALYLTMIMTFICILLSVWAAWRDHFKIRGAAGGIKNNPRGLRRRSRVHVDND